MDMLAHLWLPILLSAAAVWVAAAIAWMALPHHRGDFRRLPDQARFLEAVKGLGVSAGTYQFPFCSSHKEAMSPEGQALFKNNPCGTLVVFGNVSMGRNMVLSFLVYLAVSFLLAYVGALTLPAGSEFSKVFQVLGTVGVLSYCFAFLPGGIWFSAAPRALLMNFIDGIAYGFITGAIFAALWPAASALPG